MFEGFTALDATHKFSPEAREGLLGLWNQSLTQTAEAAVADAATSDDNTFQELIDEWVGEIKADPVLGGDKLIANQQAIGTLLDAVAGPKKDSAGNVTDPGYADEVRGALGLTGAGNHPAVFRLLTQLSALATESGMVPSKADGPQGQPTKPAAQQIFTSMPNP